ncbi:TlpA disulfide reductase family protein [Emticicia sp. 21SJ11W-3]|uniref:TlpA family protein disulfide reductase n=1 Tax=Emticicia sp. 21SJ11W-3 TaxID=2916755 RepID=UPI0020A1D162|nr:TlpA disulfide reductase family protein [Emticicia sp. 21SJ11W-3]UTA67903.1 TlpA family protein disulfide reductase [Emticicia sp. 21SJ11W-3]
MDGNKEVSKKLFEEAFIFQPSLKRKFYLPYLHTFEPGNGLHRLQMEDELVELSTQDRLNSTETWTLCTFYQNLGMTEMAENWRTKALSNFPEDKYTINHVYFYDYHRPFLKLKTSNERIRLYESYKNKYTEIKPENRDALELHLSLLLAALLPDYIETDAYQAWQQEMELLKEERRYACFALTASHLVKEKKYLPVAKELIEKSMEGETPLLNRNRDWREPFTLPDFEIKEIRKTTLAGRYHTYGQILALEGDKRKAKEYLRKAAFDYGFLKYEDINAGYISFLKETGETELAEKELALIKNMQDKIDEKTIGFQLTDVKLLKKKLPELEFHDTSGSLIDIKQLSQKVIVLDFWASWCGPCFLKFKPTQHLIDYYKDNKDVAFLFVNSKERLGISQNEILNSISSRGYSFKVLFDEKNSLETDLKINSIPAVVIIDKNRDIRFIEIGYDPAKEVNEIYSAIEKLIH